MFWERCLCEIEENEDRSPKGANMAGAIFGGILVLEGQDCFSDYLGNYFSDYFRTTFRTFSDYA